MRTGCITEAVTGNPAIILDCLCQRRFHNCSVKVALYDSQAKESIEITGGVDGSHEDPIHREWHRAGGTLRSDSVAAILAVSPVP